MENRRMNLTIFSDTHGCHPYLTIPDGDMIIFAGDMCNYGKGFEALKFRNWFEELPHKYKILIAGNHDWPFYEDRDFGRRLFQNSIYLQDESIEIEGIKIYGSPWTPEFNDWAFNLPRGKELQKKWSKIPDDTDILVSHGPLATILDNVNNLPMGCVDLQQRVLEIKPKLHIFGHIHMNHGIRIRKDTTYINAGIVDDYNTKINEAIVWEYK